MNRLIRYIISLFLCALIASSTGCEKKKMVNPNIVIMYADDMGYGDLACQNPDSKIPTPNLDRLASEGMRFSDAHSSSGICSPSRYALLTGTYHWRRQHGIVNSFGAPFFNDEDVTLPQLLQEQGYRTACIGKWHLGWDWSFKNEPSGQVEQWGRVRPFYHPADIDWATPVKGGPLDRGFDYYFGDGTINFPPYAWMENESFLQVPDTVLDINNIPYETKEGNWEFRPGPMVKGWDPYQVLPSLSEKVVDWIDRQEQDQPFLLYFPLPSPHAPIIPNDEFIGTSEAGGYGDFVVQSDWVVGQVLNAISKNKLEENTLVIFTSDNGPERYAFKRAETFGHYSMGPFRGLKRDVWEGGHHVPFIAKWPGKIAANSVSNEVISQVDLFATIAKVTHTAIPEKAAPDSYDLSSILLGGPYQSPLREATVHNTYKDKWGLRQGSWLYINAADGEHSKMPEYFKELADFQNFESTELLFDLRHDIGQRKNIATQHREQVAVMKEILERYREQGFSVARQ